MLLLALLHAGFARARSPGVDLDWQAPTGCPSREVVLKRLRTIVGKSVHRAGHLRAHGRIERHAGRYRLTLKVRDGDADTQRVVESKSCSDLAGVAAIALGLLVRGEAAKEDAAGSSQARGDGSTTSKNQDGSAGAATVSASQPQPANAKQSGPTAAEAGASDSLFDDDSPSDADSPSDVDSLSEVAPRASGSRRFRLLLRAPELGIDVGPLPEPSPTFGLAAGMAFSALELTVGARLGPTQTVRVETNPSYGAELRRAAIELRACYAFHSGDLSVGPCLFTAVDPLTARGVGDEVTSRTRTTALIAAGAGSFGRLRLGSFLALVGSVGARVEMSRAQIVVDGLGEVAKLAPFAITTSLGVEWVL